MTQHPDPPRPRKIPTQARSRATFEAVLEAATRILQAGGLSAITTNLVAETAGISVGSLYQYFPSKEAILSELVTRMRLSMSERLADASARAQELPLRQAIPMLMEAAVHQYATQPALTAALEAAEAQLPRSPEVRAGRRKVRDALVACLDLRGIPDPQEAALDIAAMTRGIVMASVYSGKADFELVRKRIEWAALGYLAERMGRSSALL